jgi:hypothetical protein
VRVKFGRIVDGMSEPPVEPERARRRRSAGRRALRSAAISGAVGLLVVLASLVVAVETGGTSWSAVNISWILFGGATGAVFGPLFTLARDDGDDDASAREEAPVQGDADTSVEGAYAQDSRRRDS